MSINKNNLIFEELQKIFDPPSFSLFDINTLNDMLKYLGWRLEDIPDFPLIQLQNMLNDLETLYTTCRELLIDGVKNFRDAEKLLYVTNSIVKEIDIFQNLRKEIENLDIDFNDFSTFENIGKELLELFILRYLATYRYNIFSFLSLLNIIDLPNEQSTPVEAIIATFKNKDNSNEIVKKIIRYPICTTRLKINRVVKFLEDPIKYLKGFYWSEDGLVKAKSISDKLFPMLEAFLRCFGLSTTYGYSPHPETGIDFGELGNEIAESTFVCVYHPDETLYNSAGTHIGATFFIVPKERGDLGLIIYPFGAFNYSTAVSGWDIKFKAEGEIGAISFGPKGVLLHSEVGDTSFTTELIISKLRDEGDDALLIGCSESTHFAIEDISLKCYALFNGNKNSKDYGIELNTSNGKIMIDVGDEDGFISNILPKDGLQLNFDLVIGFSSKDGFYFKGSGNLEATIPIHLSLGPVSLESVYVSMISDGDSKIPINLAISAKAKLGPILATVEQIGMSIPIDFGKEDKNLGIVDVGLKFKPPNGVSLVVESPTITGGGYLFFDHENGRYAGIMQLKFTEIGLTAIGLITTKMPDGKPGFSMLISICAEFPPIQLSFGFTLNGVGGLIGINRTMVTEALQAGIRNKTLDSILFPENPLVDPQKIISDMRAVFPPAKDRYVFGPMAIFGWGTPSIVTAELGIILEVPDPFRLVLLGQLKLRLPAPELPQVQINMDILGLIDFSRCLIAIDATIYDSRILYYTLSGDMAFRLKWGSHPNFLLSLGGFHPQFEAPENFPTLRRMSLSIGMGDNPRFSLNAYMAVTSNSIQFGANAQLYANYCGFKIQGFLGFDALFYLSPFSFIAEIRGSVKVSGPVTLAVGLGLTLSGPTPWYASGYAKFNVWIIDYKVKFVAEWGEKIDNELPELDVKPLLEEALKQTGNWISGVRKYAPVNVSLRKSSGDNPVIFPNAPLEIKQKVVPLNNEIDLCGHCKASPYNKFWIESIAIDGSKPEITEVEEEFAPAQYFKMSDDEKVSSPSFEKMIGGISVFDEAITFSLPSMVNAEFETYIINKNTGESEPVSEDDVPIEQDISEIITRQNIYTRAKYHRQKSRKFNNRNITPAIAVHDSAYTVVDKDNLSGLEKVTSNYIKAKIELNKHLKKNPHENHKWQIIPEEEVIG